MNRLKKIIEKTKIRQSFLEMKWLCKYSSKHAGAVAAYIVIGIFGTVMGLGNSLVSRRLIDIVTGHERDAGVMYIVAAYVLLGLFAIVSSSVSARVAEKLNIKLNLSLKERIYNKVMFSDWEHISLFKTGDLLSRINSDVSTVSSSVLGVIPTFITKLIQFSAVILVIFYFDATMALLAMTSVPFTIIVSRLLLRRIYRHSKEIREKNADVISFVSDSLQNLQTLKAFGLMKTFCFRLGGLDSDLKRARLDYNKSTLIANGVMSVLAQCVAYACYGWGVYRLWQGAISFGTMTMFLQLAATANSAFSALSGVIPQALSAAASSGRIMEILAVPAEGGADPVPESGADSLPPDFLKNCPGEKLSITFTDVSFAYKDDKKEVISGLNMTLSGSQTVALVGSSGEGKTTLFKLLLAIVKPENGKITVSCPSGVFELSAQTRCLFGYSPQTYSAFSDTVADNLRLVKPDATDDEIVSVLKASCAYGYVSALPHGIYSHIGNGAHGLSEGQLQRISIARALLSDAPVLLLDEATSALDPATARELFENINREKKGRLCVFTTHKPETLQYCDRVFVVSGNGINETDTATAKEIMETAEYR